MMATHLYVGGFFILVFAIFAWLAISLYRMEPKRTKPTMVHRLEAPMSKKQAYAVRLSASIEDTSKKAKSIKDDTVRAYWLDYVQELRVRQLKVLQEIHDKEYRDLEHDGFKLLTHSDLHSKNVQVQRGINWAADRSL